MRAVNQAQSALRVASVSAGFAFGLPDRGKIAVEFKSLAEFLHVRGAALTLTDGHERKSPSKVRLHVIFQRESLKGHRRPLVRQRYNIRNRPHAIKVAPRRGRRGCCNMSQSCRRCFLDVRKVDKRTPGRPRARLIEGINAQIKFGIHRFHEWASWRCRPTAANGSAARSRVMTIVRQVENGLQQRLFHPQCWSSCSPDRAAFRRLVDSRDTTPISAPRSSAARRRTSPRSRRSLRGT
jgi:hypothetical protein